jgi:hypothetical protein
MTEEQILQGTDEHGNVITWYWTYDSARRVTRLRCDNTGPVPLYGELVQGPEGDPRAGIKCGGVFLPGSDTAIPVPTAWDQRLQLTLRPDGQVTGVEIRIG